MQHPVILNGILKQSLISKQPDHINFMTARTHQESLDFIIKLLIIVSCYATVILIPIKIGGLGYLPGDDALRHAAYAVDDRAWGDVIVLNPIIHNNMDSHPGWHALLRGLHNNLGLSQNGLVYFSFCATFAIFMITGLLASRNALAWMCACLLLLVFGSSLFPRLLLGRPFAITMAALVALLFMWTNENVKSWSWKKEFLVVLGLLVVSICIHPSVWFIWPLPFLALIICRQFRPAFILAGATVAALMISSILCGGYDILVLPVVQLLQAFGSDSIVVGNLVTEFHPANTADIIWIAMAGLLIVRKMTGDDIKGELKKPDFWLIIIASVLGLSVSRFMLDWAIPAMAVWICRQFIILGAKVKLSRFASLGVAIVALATLYSGLTSDLGSRYTRSRKDSLLTRPLDEFEGVLPDQGGILYSSRMDIFYKLYYRNPKDHYRFILAFEPGLMPPDDLKVLRRVQFSDGLLDEYTDWMAKMTPKDRIVFYYPAKPEQEGMEFSKFYSFWIGRRVGELQPAGNQQADQQPK
ncbi:MAG: hypothetical protein LBM04_03405 [Opitutaceae bacterium]|nr:hypothetical protein [Opitutaceae bacterium]